ncbi:unnamed protein product, partial [Discosporangium mesarthrocarpum]
SKLLGTQNFLECIMGISSGSGGLGMGSLVPPLEQFSSARVKMDELLVFWVSQKETGKMLRGYLEAIASDQPFDKPGSSSLLQTLSSSASTSSLPLSPRSLSPLKSPVGHGGVGVGPAGVARSSPAAKGGHHWSPHLSPRSQRFERYLSPEKRSPSRSSGVSEESTVSRPREAARKVPEGSVRVRRADIPRFWVKGEGGRGRGRPLPRESLEARRQEIQTVFSAQPDGLGLEEFVHVTKTLCGFPSFFNAVLFKRVLATTGSRHGGGGDMRQGEEGNKVVQGGTDDFEVGPDARITLTQFQDFFDREIEPYDHIDRFFRLVKKPCNDYIEKDDLQPFMRELLLYHPGLEFLEAHPDFHPKYATTVTTRIFYIVNTSHEVSSHVLVCSRCGRISQGELRQSNLVKVFNTVDEEEDINKVTEYFSYEHFYVVFCRFYELDADRDGRLSREDLMKYGEHGLSQLIVDRIMSVGPRPFPQGRVNEDGSDPRATMTYEDYVYFMLSEEDRGNKHSLRYWFTCVDLDGDGCIGHMEMRLFYDSQIHRMESLGHEVVPFEDVVCQMWDMLKLGDRNYVTLQDFLKPEALKVAGVFFDALFNLNKFIGFEQRDPFAERQKRNDPFKTNWDSRFAFHDYNRLAAEDERDVGDSLEIDVSDDWIVTDDDEDADDMLGRMGQDASGTVEAPF